MKPTFIGIGVQKCATTWVHRILRDHPQTWLSHPKELDFFSYYYGFGFQWYEEYFKGGTGKLAIGEISSSYFHDLAAPFRAHLYEPSLRIIVCFRDPVERLYSNHLHELRLGHIKGKDLSVEACLANNPMYLEQSLYATHLQRWLDWFPREQLLVLVQEEIGESPEEQARQIYQFLGIDPDFQSSFLFQRSNVSMMPRSKSIEYFIKRLGWLGRRLGLNSAVTRIRRNRIVASIRMANTATMYGTIPDMLPETRVALQKELAGEVMRLAELLGRENFPWPTWDAVKG
jgi:hypothetical protein